MTARGFHFRTKKIPAILFYNQNPPFTNDLSSASLASRSAFISDLPTLDSVFHMRRILQAYITASTKIPLGKSVDRLHCRIKPTNRLVPCTLLEENDWLGPRGFNDSIPVALVPTTSLTLSKVQTRKSRSALWRFQDI
jgi:hypothetical protein